MPRGRRWAAVVSAARSSMGRGRRVLYASRSSRKSRGPSVSEGGARPSALRAPRPALRWVARCGRPAPRSATLAPLRSSSLFAPPRAGCAPSPVLRRRGLARRPSLGARCVLAFLPFRALISLRRSIPVHNRHSAYSHRTSGRSGLFAGAPRCPCRAPGPGATGPPRGTPRAGALAALGTAVVASLRFFSAGATCSGQGLRGFPPGAVARGLPPSTPARAPAMSTHYLIAPGARGDPVAVLGATPLRPSRGPACGPRTPAARTAGASFLGGPHWRPPMPPSLVFFMVFWPCGVPVYHKKT